MTSDTTSDTLPGVLGEDKKLKPHSCLTSIVIPSSDQFTLAFAAAVLHVVKTLNAKHPARK